MNYITKDDTIIFDRLFNEQLDHELLTNYKQLIFSYYELNNDLFDIYEKFYTYNYYERYKNTMFDEFYKFKYLRSKFNHPVDSLPTSITHLTFGSGFNQSVDALPSSITHLTFGRHFNQSVSNLPSSITHITFGSAFNHPVNMLPSSIQNLKFGVDFNHELNNLPPNLEFIELHIMIIIVKS